MKKRLRYLLLLAFSFILVACGAKSDTSDDSSTIKIGASNVPHAMILEQAKPILEEEGINLEIITYSDYVLPNVALEEGDIDANYFQHIPFFEETVEENGYDFVNLGGIHLEPMGAYSKRHKELKDLPDGAKILVSNSFTDHGRVLAILEEAGLIKVNNDINLATASFDDIEENPKNLTFEYEFDPALMPTLLEQDEGDVVFINSNFAVDHGISPLEDAIAIESSSSPYANIIAARAEDKDSEALAKLVEVLHSKEIKDYILSEWDGTVVPVD